MATTFSGQAFALGDASRLGVGKLKVGADWNQRPEAIRRLLFETNKRTSIHTRREATVTEASGEMFWSPLTIWTGEAGFSLSRAESAMLQRYLRFGGLLWIDAPSSACAFYQAARETAEDLLPKSDIHPLTKEHVLFKSYYLQGGAAGKNASESQVYAADVHGRAAVLLTSCDVLGAFERDKLGSWTYDCIPGGATQREHAFRFGVNVMMYATCIDYKADQVHIPFIMKKKRR